MTQLADEFRQLCKETKPLCSKYRDLLGQLAVLCNTAIKDDIDLDYRMSLVVQLFNCAEHDNDLAAILANVMASKIREYEQAKVAIPQVSQAEALAHFIGKHQLRQKDLAEVAPQSVISEILRGKRKMTVAHIKGFARRFRVPEQTFMG